jgi:hypothetical protein
MKITFLGAGSTIFARNVLGDVMMTEALRDAELALYDIDPVRSSSQKPFFLPFRRASLEAGTALGPIAVSRTGEKPSRMHYLW